MLSIYLCDDNKPHLTFLKKTLENLIFIYELDVTIGLATSNPIELLNTLKTIDPPAIYFLDVDLQFELNGIELAEKIRQHDPRGFIIFITTHSEAAPLTFQYKVEAMDYIIKDEPDIISDRMYSCLMNALKKYADSNNTIHKTISFQVEGNIVSVKLDHIISIHPSSNSHKTLIYTTSGMMEFNKTMKEISKSLSEEFFQSHKSCIINLKYICSIDKKQFEVTMSDGRTCPISTRYMNKLLSVLQNN